ncbi:HER2 [Sanghuangporus weigelae]
MTSKHLNATLCSLKKFLRSSHISGSRRRHSDLASTSEHFAEWTNAYVSYDDSLLVADSSSSGPLRSMSIALKDNICTKSFKTTCSSAMLQDFVSPYDATVVRLLRDAGATILGKTNCDEFGMGSFNVHSIHGPVVNPFQALLSQPDIERERRSAGGSSGGSAAAVASGSCFAALGTDTGGSIRLPAAYCGVAGLKPSYGLISRHGIVSYADSLDCVGVLAREAGDIESVFKVLSIHDPRDPSSASEDTRTRAAESSFRSLPQTDSLQGLKVGIPQEYFPRELDESAIRPLRELVERLKLAGAEVVPVSLPATRYALSAYYVIASAEASSNLARYSGIHHGLRIAPPPDANRKRVSDVYSYSRSKGFGHEVQKRILLGTYALTADAFDNYFLQAQRVRNLLKADFDRVFRISNPLSPSCHRATSLGVDVLLHPSAIRSAPLLSETGELSTLEAYVQDVLTVPASLAGLPALSIPAGLAKDGWPLGVSVVGQWGHDEMILKVGEIIQRFVKE